MKTLKRNIFFLFYCGVKLCLNQLYILCKRCFLFMFKVQVLHKYMRVKHIYDAYIFFNKIYYIILFFNTIFIILCVT